LPKIEVEGEERRLLRGARQSIRRHRPKILLECSDSLRRGRGTAPPMWEPVAGKPAPLREEMDSLNVMALPE
jgi:hypothetical protein